MFLQESQFLERGEDTAQARYNLNRQEMETYGLLIATSGGNRNLLANFRQTVIEELLKVSIIYTFAFLSVFTCIYLFCNRAVIYLSLNMIHQSQKLIDLGLGKLKAKVINCVLFSVWMTTNVNHQACLTSNVDATFV